MDIITGTFDEERAALEERLDEILDAVRLKDFDRLAGYHLASPKFSKFDDFEPLDRQDIEAANRAEAEGLGEVENFTGRFDDLKLDVFGSVAVVTGIFVYAFEMGGEAMSLKARTTLVFVRDLDDWKIAHEHLSPFKSNP